MKKENKQIIVYQGKSGEIALHSDFGAETVWATQAQIALLFEKDRTVITKHLHKIFKDGEVSKKSNVQKMHIPLSDKLVELY
ncbi:MAG: virulence protein [Patescibacteria group bacterium]